MQMYLILLGLPFQAKRRVGKMEEEFDEQDVWGIKAIAGLTLDEMHELFHEMEYYLAHPKHLRERYEKIIGGLSVIERLSEKICETF
jgi:hypothetical protein